LRCKGKFIGPEIAALSRRVKFIVGTEGQRFSSKCLSSSHN
jgi:hypothetical protein